MKKIANSVLVASAALAMFACASTTPRADAPAAAGAPATSAAAAAPAPAAAAPGAPGAIGSTAGQPDSTPLAVVVTYIPKDKVADTFKKGGPLFAAENFKISAGHRDDAKHPGEVHTKDTDIFYILDGSATFVTGGELVDGAPDKGNAEELRGPSVKGGESHKLQKGDVIVIPRGTPHHFTEVTGPFNYFVVKVAK
jgi:quercetin dioxygenase-like cupin family protein